MKTSVPSIGRRNLLLGVLAFTMFSGHLAIAGDTSEVESCSPTQVSSANLDATNLSGRSIGDDIISLSDHVDRIFQPWTKTGSPGCAVGILSKGKLVYQQGYGLANLEYDVPITSESVFYLPSTSKQFTAACIALLHLRGKLSLDDDIRKYLPDMPDYGAPISIRHLVHHTSGIHDWLELLDLAGFDFRDYWNNGHAMDILRRQQRLNFPPGEKHLYCNSGYILMAEIVAKVSGQSLRQFAHQNLFEPLGMKHTHFDDDRSAVVPNRVVSYTSTGEGTYKRYLKNFDSHGDGNLLTTVEDLARWDQNFTTGKVGGQKFVNLMVTRGKLNNGTELDYAFGLAHTRYRGLDLIRHSGGFLGFRSEMIRCPEHQFTVICLSNLAEVNALKLSKKVIDIFLNAQSTTQHEEPQTPVANSTASMDQVKASDYVGTYHSEELDTDYFVSLVENQLFVEGGMKPTARLTMIGKDILKAPFYTLRFSRDAQGKVNCFYLDCTRVQNLRFSKQ